MPSLPLSRAQSSPASLTAMAAAAPALTCCVCRPQPCPPLQALPDGISSLDLRWDRKTTAWYRPCGEWPLPNEDLEILAKPLADCLRRLPGGDAQAAGSHVRAKAVSCSIRHSMAWHGLDWLGSVHAAGTQELMLSGAPGLNALAAAHDEEHGLTRRWYST